MRRVHVHIACSLDGHVARPAGAVDRLAGPAGDDVGYAAFGFRDASRTVTRETRAPGRSFAPFPQARREVLVPSRSRSGRGEATCRGRT